MHAGRSFRLTSDGKVAELLSIRSGFVLVALFSGLSIDGIDSRSELWGHCCSVAEEL
jgi:hypothetical protein